MSHSHVQLFAIPWIIGCLAPLSMKFSRQEYWSGLPFHSLGDLPGPGIELGSPALQADSLPSEPPGNPKCRRPWFDSWVWTILWRRDRLPTPLFLGSPCGSAGKESACNVGDQGSIPGLGRALEKGKATHSSIPAWRIPWYLSWQSLFQLVTLPTWHFA